MEKILTREIVKELGLDRLEVITLDMLDGYISIGYDAFGSSPYITSINIPNSVTYIGSYAFMYCSNLTSIIIPDSVTSIGSGAFLYCSSLTSITLPNSVKSIGVNTFDGCSLLTSIILPNSIISIENFAFRNCSNLVSITIPNSITKIGLCTFYKCNKLKNVVIGDKTYKVQEVINDKCKSYKAFKGNMTCREFQYEEGKTYEIEGEPKICLHGFHACLRLTDVFNYYRGEIGKNIVVHEVELENVSKECHEDDSKVVAGKITIGKRIL